MDTKPGILRTTLIGGILAPQVVEVLLLLLFCLAARLFARTAVAKRFGQFLGTKVLGNSNGRAGRVLFS